MGRVTAPDPGYLNIDLLIMEREKTRNRGYAYGLVIIDIYSRYLWVLPMKRKFAVNARDVFKTWYKETVPSELKKIWRIKSDNGKEFLGAFKKYVESLKIPHRYIEVGDHNANAHVERVNQTIRKRILDFWIVNQNLNWIDHIQEIVKDYNNTKHSGIKETPYNVLINGVTPYRAPRRDVPDLKVGENVRFQLERKRFDKASSTISWSKDVYPVEEKRGGLYKLKGREKLYSRYELRKSAFDEEENGELENLFSEKEKVVKDRRVERRINKTGIDRDVVQREKRVRKAPDRGFFVVD
jgi:hypothetical protein